MTLGGRDPCTWVILEAHNGYIIHTEYIVCTEIRAEVGTEHILYRKGQKLMQNSAIALGEYRTHDTRMAHRFHPGTDGGDDGVPTTLGPRQGPRANAHRDKISRKGNHPSL